MHTCDHDEREVTELLEERDRLHEIADRLSWAIAPIEVIGEHSSGNCPWENAIEIAENSVVFRADADTLERVAKAIHAEYRKTNPDIHRSGWDDIDPLARGNWLAEAQAAVSALTPSSDKEAAL